MEATKLIHGDVILEKDKLEIAQTLNEDLELEQDELVVDCPDCFNTMFKIHDLEKVRYQCENCDLIIGNDNWR